MEFVPRPGLRVSVANGDRVPTSGLCSGLPLSISQEDFTINCYDIPLGSFDVVLGVQWLRTLGPIQWDFKLSMSFWCVDHRVLWHGVGTAPDGISTQVGDGQDLVELLEEFANIFETPQGVPPQRRHDHRIHLLLGLPPAEVCPHRYL